MKTLEVRSRGAARAWTGALALAALAGSAHAAAVYSATAIVSGQPYDIDTGQLQSSQQLIDQDLDSLTRASASMSSAAPFTAQAFAAADFGVLRVLASGTSTSLVDTYWRGGASARAQYQDEVTLTADGLTGSGVAFARVFLHTPSGMLSSTNPTVAPAGLNGSVHVLAAGGGSINPFWFSGLLNQTFPSGWAQVSVPGEHPTIEGYWDLEIPFSLGQPFGLRLSAFASAGSGSTRPFPNPDGHTATASFASSFYWAGIQSIRVGNVTTTDFEAIGSSGNDWRASYAPGRTVPEPGTWALLLAAGVSMGMARRRRRR